MGSRFRHCPTSRCRSKSTKHRKLPSRVHSRRGLNFFKEPPKNALQHKTFAVRARCIFQHSVSAAWVVNNAPMGSKTSWPEFTKVPSRSEERRVGEECR